MKLYYASRTGNVEKLVQKLGIPEPVKITDGSEIADDDFIFITYTDGKGIIPPIVEKFLDTNKGHCKGAAVSGSLERHADTFCFAADKIIDKYNIRILDKFDKDGNETTVKKITAAFD